MEKNQCVVKRYPKKKIPSFKTVHCNVFLLMDLFIYFKLCCRCDFAAIILQKIINKYRVKSDVFISELWSKRIN